MSVDSKIVKSVEEFCKNPSSPSFSVKIKKLNLNWIVLLLQTWSEFCIETGQGDVKKAKKILKIIEGKENRSPINIPENIKPIFSLMKFLQNESFAKITTRNYPKAVVDLGSKNNLVILYNNDKDLPDMYLILEDIKEEVEKELVMNYENGKEYIIDLFQSHPKFEIKSISIQLSDEVPKRIFYKQGVGYTWNRYIEGDELTDKEKKASGKNFFIEYMKKEVKTCPVCDLGNSPKSKKCKACEADL